MRRTLTKADVMQEQLTQKTADSAAAGSAVFASAAWIADVEPFLTAGAAAVAIIAGIAAAWYHLERAAGLRAARKDAEEDRASRRANEANRDT